MILLTNMPLKFFLPMEKMLGTWSQKENRIFVPKDSISPHMFEALVATEDSRFYDHCGIDGRAVLRAIVKAWLLWGNAVQEEALQSRSSLLSNYILLQLQILYSVCFKSL